MIALRYMVVVIASAVAASQGGPASRPAETQPSTASRPADDAGGKVVALPLELPKPKFKETPKNVPPGTKLEKPRSGPRPPFLVPEGVVMISRGKTVTASDSDPIIGKLSLITDGDKEANEGSYVELGPGKQWVQIDLEKAVEVHAVVVWHSHGAPRVYHAVVVQISDDPEFKTGVTTVFNNDHANLLGLGAGGELGYWETFEGKLINARRTHGRYVRCWSRGNTDDDLNRYTEVEVWGRAEQ